MPDDLSKRGMQDRASVSLSEEHEVWYWVEKFGVSKDELSEAVDQVGNNVDAVAAHPKKAI